MNLKTTQNTQFKHIYIFVWLDWPIRLVRTGFNVASTSLFNVQVCTSTSLAWPYKFECTSLNVQVWLGRLLNKTRTMLEHSTVSSPSQSLGKCPSATLLECHDSMGQINTQLQFVAHVPWQWKVLLSFKPFRRTRICCCLLVCIIAFPCHVCQCSLRLQQFSLCFLFACPYVS